MIETRVKNSEAQSVLEANQVVPIKCARVSGHHRSVVPAVLCPPAVSPLLFCPPLAPCRPYIPVILLHHLVWESFLNEVL